MARYAIVLKDGTIANICELDPASEGGQSYVAQLTKAGLALVKLEDHAGLMGGVNVEPGDKCTNVAAKTFVKGVLGTSPLPKLDPEK
jgi:hypothetical protein